VGPDEPFREFFAAQYGPLRRLGFLLTGSWDQGEELAQEALVRTWAAWRRVRRHPVAYARQVLVNHHRSRLRRLMVEARQRGRLRRDEAVVPDLGEEGMVLWAAVRRLPPRQRAVLVLRYHEDLTEVEVAGLLGVPLGTVKSLHHRGLRRLRGELGDHQDQDGVPVARQLKELR
jgi:RNA polymerase sigma-70 factor (sigma-E family)